jgi:hypothetical protein
VITAEDSPEIIIEKIADVMEQYAPGYMRHSLSAKEVLKNGELEQAGSSPFEFPQGQEDLVRKVFPLIDCQEGMLTWLNERKVGEAAAILPLRFECHPMIKVQNGALGRVAADQRAPSGETGPEPGPCIEAAMQRLFKHKKILQLFEWNGDKWREYRKKTSAGVTPYYKLASAIIRTNWEGVDEYLFVHWIRYYDTNPFVRGKRWIDAFNAAIKAGEKPSLGEVCALFYRVV